MLHVRTLIILSLLSFALIACSETGTSPTVQERYQGSQTINGTTSQIQIVFSKSTEDAESFSASITSTTGSFSPITAGCSEGVVFTECKSTIFGSNQETRQVSYNGIISGTVYSGTLTEQVGTNAATTGNFSVTKVESANN